jgi:hypothetical protein
MDGCAVYKTVFRALCSVNEENTATDEWRKISIVMLYDLEQYGFCVYKKMIVICLSGNGDVMCDKDVKVYMQINLHEGNFTH